MKTSIKALLSNLQFNLLIQLIMIVITAFIAYALLAGFERIENIDSQKQLVEKVAHTDLQDKALGKIEIDGAKRQLSILISKYEAGHVFDFIDTYMVDNGDDRAELVARSKEEYGRFASAADAFVASFDQNRHPRAPLLKAADAYTNDLMDLLLLEDRALYQYFQAFIFAIGIIFVWSLFVFLAAKRAGNILLKDAFALQKIGESSAGNAKFQTTEMNAVAMKFRQNQGDLFVPGKQDPLTLLQTYEGLKSSFEQRAGKMKDSGVFVCLFEIDNYAKITNHYPESVIDPILVKIASFIKLHKMQSDLVARYEDGKFLMVLFRNEKRKAFEECENVRLMVEGNRFKLPHDSIPVTLSGVFLRKQPEQTLDSTVKKAEDSLEEAYNEGRNILIEYRSHRKML